MAAGAVGKVLIERLRGVDLNTILLIRVRVDPVAKPQRESEAALELEGVLRVELVLVGTEDTGNGLAKGDGFAVAAEVVGA